MSKGASYFSGVGLYALAGPLSPSTTKIQKAEYRIMNNSTAHSPVNYNIYDSR